MLARDQLEHRDHRRPSAGAVMEALSYPSGNDSFHRLRGPTMIMTAGAQRAGVAPDEAMLFPRPGATCAQHAARLAGAIRSGRCR
jgi:hypothetical protein